MGKFARIKPSFWLIATVVFLTACGAAVSPSPSLETTVQADAPVYTYRILNQYPHDPEAFTQGLVWLDNNLYESTGLYGRSSLRRIALETGDVLQMVSLSEQFFGEGIVIWDAKIIQITWKEQKAFVYDLQTFETVGTFDYDTEGWGITHDGRRLIMSDGSQSLFFRDPKTFEETGRIEVFDGKTPVTQLNELEYIQGEVWANIWQTSLIARIDPESGQVTGWVDLTGLLENADPTGPVNVLNGIAYDPELDRLFVTGKLWPALFEIEIIPSNSSS